MAAFRASLNRTSNVSRVSQIQMDDLTGEHYLTPSVHSVKGQDDSRLSTLETFVAIPESISGVGSKDRESRASPTIEVPNLNSLAAQQDKDGEGEEEQTLFATMRVLLDVYGRKFRGVDGRKPPEGTVNCADISFSTLFTFLGIFCILAVDLYYLGPYFPKDNIVILIGSFGANAVLVFDSYLSPLAQPRNVFFGQVLCSFIGVCVRLLADEANRANGVADVTTMQWWPAPLAVALSVAVMRLFNIVNPPGGAAALIAVTGGASVYNLGFGFVATNAGGAIISIGVAMILNNLLPWRQYPLYF